MTKEGFLKAWKGSVTLENSVLNLSTIQNPQSKILSASQTQKIRGAFWGSLLGLIGSILSFIPGLNGLGFILTAISAAVSAIEGDFISAISSIVTLGLGNIGSFFSSAFDGVIKAMGPIGQAFSAVGKFVGNIYQSVTGFFGGISKTLGGFLNGTLGIQSATAARIAETVVGTGLNFGISKGLTTLAQFPQLTHK